MKISFPRDIPRRAAAVAVALALIASVVTGVEEPPADVQAGPSPPSPSSTSGSVQQESLPELELDKLNRAHEEKKVADLFAPRAVALAPPPVIEAPIIPLPPTPPPAPTAPPLPFRYFGKWIEGDRTVVFLWNNNEGHSASVGDTLGGSYRIESVTDSAVNFVYLPLGSRQSLPIAKPD